MAETVTTLKLYHDDPHLLDFEAEVVERITHAGRPAVVLDRTGFYAESGGQPWDLGTLDGVAVTGVVENAGRVVHLLERPLDGDATRVRGRVDGTRRVDHIQQHHGQHLLSRAFVTTCGAHTVAFHLGSEDTTIDLERAVGPDELRRGLRRANEIVWEARPVTVHTLSRADAAALGCEVPEEAGDAVRVVDAGGFDVQPCSGTHPRSTAEVGVIAALHAERVKGATRLHFLCGWRALAAVETRFAALDQVGAALAAPLGQLADAARRTLDDLTRERKRGAELLGRALAGEAQELLARPSAATPEGVPVVLAAFDVRPAAELRGLAQALTARGPCIALLGSRGDNAQLVFARSPGLTADVAALLQAALALVGGRGGGRGDIVQGGGPLAQRLDEALAAAAARLSA